MLTYPRFAKACYAFFLVAVLAAILKLSVSGAELSLLKMLPTVPTASALERVAASPIGPEDPRLGSFSDDGGAERLEAAFSRPPSREDAPQAAEDPASDVYDASVFRRPSLDSGSSEPVCGDLGDAPRSSRVVFPLPEAYFNSYDDTWGAARPQGGHEGSDLMSPTGTPEFAITDGRLVSVAGSNENGWNRLGGYTVMLEAAYDVGPIKKGDLFYYAHLDREGALPLGTEVRAGQRIGTVGDTGEGPEVTRGKFPPHLHLGWYDAELSEERSEAESGAMNPYPLLLWLERNGGAVSGGTDASYCQAPQGPTPTPSTGETDWPIPAASGETPDLDTGSDESASPRPIVRREEHRHDHQGHNQNEIDRPSLDDDGDGAGDEQQAEGDEAGDEEQVDNEAGSEQQPEGEEVESEQEAEGDGGEDEQQAEDGAIGNEQQADETEAEGDEATESQDDQEEKKALSLRRKLEARKAALKRDRPNVDRVTSKDRDERVRGEAKNGRRDEKPADERGKGRQETKRPTGNRPEGNENASSREEKQAPKPSAPAAPASRERREPDLAPERTGKAPKATKEPEPVEPPAPEADGSAGDGAASGAQGTALPADEPEVGEE